MRDLGLHAADRGNLAEPSRSEGRGRSVCPGYPALSVSDLRLLQPASHGRRQCKYEVCNLAVAGRRRTRNRVQRRRSPFARSLRFPARISCFFSVDVISRSCLAG
ncbi:hypothetical protein GUJ93_ZPchr0009g1476 [Zizania palustris]|uniref:Uncharacterized protein n=1 Tax=Zizania palustris TaxID=103762 RepID=A0A8J5RP96_ZIZPA|nr:hypothetical protein GUJ93_ZPchr0009g1476 [Zizania palustris]